MENQKPELVELRGKSPMDYASDRGIVTVVDRYDDLIEELFLIRNPKHKFDPNYAEPLKVFRDEHLAGKSTIESGKWFFFPWSNTMIHYMDDELHQELRTARNRNLITKEEQDKYADTTVGIAGLSVGSHAAMSIAMMGGSRRIKIADMDELSITNLNRVRYDASKLGSMKCDIVRDYIYQLDPYCTVESYKEGLTDKNIDNFFDGLDVLVDELDNLEFKIKMRMKAKEKKIPVLMATDNGDNAIVDIERYDLNLDQEMFNGAAGDITVEEFKHMHPTELPKLATKIAGPKQVVPKMMKSLLQVGREIYSWPQLGDAATLSGVAIAYLVKRVAQGERLDSGKYEINLDAIFDPEYSSEKSKKEREEIRNDFLKKIGLDEFNR